jgi:hypothetical protein
LSRADEAAGAALWPQADSSSPQPSRHPACSTACTRPIGILRQSILSNPIARTGFRVHVSRPQTLYRRHGSCRIPSAFGKLPDESGCGDQPSRRDPEDIQYASGRGPGRAMAGGLA